MATLPDKSTPAPSERKKPLLFGTTYADDIERLMETNEIMENDPGYIPGYSEAVRSWELSLIDPTVENFSTSRHIRTSEGLNLRDHYIKKYGEPKPLPVRFKWVRVEDMKGDSNAPNVRKDLVPYVKDGYTFATSDDLARYNYGVPPQAIVSADGTIRRGDVALVVVDAEGAKRADAKKARLKAERETGSSHPSISVEHTRQSNYVP